MSRSANVLRTGWSMILNGQLADARREVVRRFGSTSTRVVLQRDLLRPFQVPTAKIPISVRPITLGERETFIREAERSPDNELKIRSRIMRVDMGTCYAAVDAAGHIGYVQWLFTSADNRALSDFFGKNFFPEIDAEEVLLEGAYTLSSHRRLGVMAAAMALIAQAGLEHGARRALTFVGDDNDASIRGCVSAGFTPCQRRYDQWRLLRRNIVLEATGPVDSK